MPSNTVYNPINVNDFEKSKLNFDAQTTSGTITAGTTQNVDLALTDDCLMTGAWLIVNGGNYGDTAVLQVVDVSGLFAPPGTVLNSFANWSIPPTVSQTFEMVYPAKIYAGLTIRIAYTSTGSSNPFVAINYMLHKVLV